MATVKKVQIQNPSGTGYNERDIGAEAQYIDISRDSEGQIITDLETQTVESTESLAETLKTLETDTAIDTALNTTSEHAVQNKVITTELNKKLSKYNNDTSAWDTTPTQNSTKPVTSGGVYSYIDTMITKAIAASY